MSELPGRPQARTLLLRFLVVAVLVALDLWSKHAVFAWLEGSLEMQRDACGHKRLHVLGDDVGWFTFMLSLNPGAAFGQFASWPHVLVGGRIIAVLFLCFLVIRTETRRPWFTAALVLVMSGALGNLYDNLMMPRIDDRPYGMVRDFIDVYFANWNWHFPTFNVADSCITVGAVLLLLSGLGKQEPVPDSSPPPESNEPPAGPDPSAL